MNLNTIFRDYPECTCGNCDDCDNENNNAMFYFLDHYFNTHDDDGNGTIFLIDTPPDSHNGIFLSRCYGEGKLYNDHEAIKALIDAIIHNTDEQNVALFDGTFANYIVSQGMSILDQHIIEANSVRVVQVMHSHGWVVFEDNIAMAKSLGCTNIIDELLRLHRYE